MVYFTEKELATIALEAIVKHGMSAADVHTKMCSVLASKGSSVEDGKTFRRPSTIEEIAAAAIEAQTRSV